jgi:hypothetical protein
VGSIMICTSHQNSIQVIKLRGVKIFRVMWHMRGQGEAPTGFWWGNLEENIHMTKI